MSGETPSKSNAGAKGKKKADNPAPPAGSSHRKQPEGPQFDAAEQLIGQLFWAWHARPGHDTPERASWDLRFTKACKELARMVIDYQWKTLPGFAIGCIWAHNERIRDVS